MTPEQLQTFADDIAVNGAIVGLSNSDIVIWYNTIASPDFWVFKSSVTVDAVVEAMDWAADYATFKDDVAGISLLLQNGTYRPVEPGAREALNAVFAGAANTKTAVLNVATRTATRGEQVFAETTTGPGGGDGTAQVNSAIARFEGNVTLQNVRDAKALIP
jgi:hypothetical protein